MLLHEYLTEAHTAICESFAKAWHWASDVLMPLAMF
jgi:hypothetical protein